MITQTKFRELTKKAVSEQCNATSMPLDQALKIDDVLSAQSFARVNALSSQLSIDADDLLQALLEASLGDAHQGYLSAFDNAQERELADQSLKEKVHRMLAHSEEN